jgi:hypothetical protein
MMFSVVNEVGSVAHPLRLSAMAQTAVQVAKLIFMTSYYWIAVGSAVISVTAPQKH